MSLTEVLERDTDPRPLALVRIVVGLSAIALAVFVERDGLVRLGAEDVFHSQTFAWLPTLTPGFVDAAVALWIGLALALTVGLFARLAAAGLAIVTASTIALDLQAFSNHVTLLIVLSGLLALGQPSATWSLDARRRGARTSIPYWPVFLIKFQISSVYAFAALTKLNGSFLSAEVLSSRWELVVGPEPGGVILGGLTAIAISTVLVESFLSIALWSERWRRVALPLGLALHTAIAATLGAVLIPFGTLMLGAYVLFPVWRPGSRRVVWDSRDHGVDRFVAAFSRIDWLGIHEYAPVERADGPGGGGALRVDAPSGTTEGFDAARAMLGQSPVTFLVAPLLGLRPFAALGSRLYERLVAPSPALP